jgi:hypothetical protein
MTWVPIQAGSDPERDAVLGLKAEPYRGLREILEISFQITDPALLDRCRLRLAQLMESRAEVAGEDERRLAELAGWERDPELGSRERAALSFTEQYQIDHHGVTDQQKADLESELSRRGMVNFVWALHMNDAYIRALSLLDIGPDPVAILRPERGACSGAGSTPASVDATQNSDKDDETADLRDPGFAEAYDRLNKMTVTQSLIDDVTSESVRLRNARFQGCRY